MAFIHPMPLVRIPQPFSDPAWIFELKLDGFRALAFVEAGACRLVSRNGHTFRQFDALQQSLAAALPDGVYDGEICVLDRDGRSRFNDLLFRRRSPVFALFDLLCLRGRDVRGRSLLERKRQLERAVQARSAALLRVQHVEAQGIELYHAACELDLEGVVGKWLSGTYQSDGAATSWVKIKNPNYSQAEGRRELFERRGRASRHLKSARKLVLA